jgi:hypothetical protein
VFESEVISAFKQAIDAEGEERQTLTSTSVAWNSRELSGFGATDAGVKGVRCNPRYCPRQTSLGHSVWCALDAVQNALSAQTT